MICLVYDLFYRRRGTIMIIVMKPNAEESAVKKIITKIEEKGLHTHLSQGEEVLIIGVVGDKSKLDTNAICALPSQKAISCLIRSSTRSRWNSPLAALRSVQITLRSCPDHVP